MAAGSGNPLRIEKFTLSSKIGLPMERRVVKLTISPPTPTGELFEIRSDPPGWRSEGKGFPRFLLRVASLRAHSWRSARSRPGCPAAPRRPLGPGQQDAKGGRVLTLSRTRRVVKIPQRSDEASHTRR